MSEATLAVAALALRAELGEVRLEQLAALGGSDRSNVSRATLHGGRSGGATSVVVKAYQGRDAMETWSREVAALEVVRGTAAVPRLLAAAPDPPLAVLEDLGDGDSVAAALLGSDAQAATSAVMAWAGAVADLHVATLGAHQRFRDALATRAPAQPAHSVPVMLARAAKMLAEHAQLLDLAVSRDQLDALQALSERLPDADHAALSPGDTCPDNNLWRGEQLHLLDFEWAEHRHVAWDVAYLLVPWPSCWCSWRLPAEVAAGALRRYRERMGPHLPYVTTADFDADLRMAELGWTLVSTAWFLGRAITGDPPPPPPAPPAPARRALILHRLRRSRSLDAPTELSRLVADLEECLRRRWGSHDLAFAPAWRGRASLV